MKAQRLTLLFANFLLLMAVVSPVLGETKKQGKTASTKAKANPVTITLVRWPYT